MGGKRRRTRPDVAKRVVFHYTQGRYAGLHQIIGTMDAMLGGLGVTTLPEFFPDVPVEGGDRRTSFSLVRVRRRLIEYQELIVPSSAQHIDTPFHPAQL